MTADDAAARRTPAGTPAGTAASRGSIPAIGGPADNSAQIAASSGSATGPVGEQDGIGEVRPTEPKRSTTNTADPDTTDPAPGAVDGAAAPAQPVAGAATSEAADGGTGPAATDMGEPEAVADAPDAAQRATGSHGESPAGRPRPIDWGDEEITPPAATAAAAGRRHPIAALVLLAVGAAALWGSSRLTWVTVTSADGLTEPRTDELNGGIWFGALTPLALVLLAAIAAVLATRGWLRRSVGVVVALIAAVTAVPALALLTGSGATEQRAADLAGLPGRAQVQELVTSPGPAVLTLCGALAAFGAGLLLARMPADTKQLSGKYDNPATRKAAATEAVQQRASGDVLPERVLWDALDAGADPTESAATADPTEPGGTDELPERAAATGSANESAEATSADRAGGTDGNPTTDRPDARRPHDTP
ncbi:TIGR02234 family membrane protein [Nocardia carnea]|uniref:TIGR02234 family membrane protein n=1 Tax=Nocardia carnea TaxID=37328 RepID=UPI002455E15A|nr:TIGR02234 family membrane protein [Nocardia carnea]